VPEQRAASQERERGTERRATSERARARAKTLLRCSCTRIVRPRGSVGTFSDSEPPTLNARSRVGSVALALWWNSVVWWDAEDASRAPKTERKAH